MPQIDLKLSKSIFNQYYYSDLFDYSKRYEIFYGGAGSGKSYFITQKLLIKALNERRKILVIRKVARTLKDSCFQLFLDTIEKFQLTSYVKINRSNYTIELPNKSLILFYGMDNSEKIKSITGITDIWLEETTEFTEDDITQLDLRLRDAKAANQQIYYSFNPVSKANICYKKWFADDATYDKERTTIFHSTYKDNKFLPDSYISSLEALKEQNPTYYKIYALGEFGSLDKVIFNNWEIGAMPENKSKLELLIGLDFGFTNDATALVIAYLDENSKTIYVETELYKKGLTNNEIALSIENLGISKSLIIADSAEPKSIEELRRAGIRRIKAASKGKDSILSGIQKLQQYKIVVNPNCENLIVELQNYSWQKDKATNEYINKPIDSFNHAIDALRYSLQCVEQGKLRTINKQALGL